MDASFGEGNRGCARRPGRASQGVSAWESLYRDRGTVGKQPANGPREARALKIVAVAENRLAAACYTGCFCALTYSRSAALMRL